MPLFGSKSATHQLRVLTLDYVVEGTADISGQNLIRLFVLTGATMRAASGSTPPAPRGSTWAIGEVQAAVIGVAPVDEAGHDALLRFVVTGKHQLQADVYTGPYRVRGTILAPDDDPKVLVNLGRLMVRDAEVECLAPGAELGVWQAPSVLLFMNQLQGLVLA